jgi:8-oxo-dGTP pyrophosphatase MutT (NUDIX family)
MSAYGAGLLIYRLSDRRILMTRRSPGETSPGSWDFAGGSVEPGETYLQAALREGREELGSLPGLFVDSEPFWWAPDPFFAFAIFLAQMDASGEGWEPVLNDEHDMYGWFEPQEIPKPALPGVTAGMRHFFGT